MSNAGRVPLDIEQEKAELQAVLSSKLLAHAPSLSKLLLHICNKHFSGEVGQIKEYTIAVEIFNRPADFQSREDSIVRVEANRLREKLKKYYRTEGLNHRVWISIPPGQYGPVFEYKQFSDLSEGCASSAEDAAEATNSASTETGHGAEVPGCEQGFRIEPGGAQSPKGVLSQRYVLYFVAFLVGVLALAITGFITLSRDSFRSISTGSTKTLPSVAVSSPVPKVPEGPELRIMPGCGREGCVDRIGNQWLG
ncbi:MAG TPA: hypothetical protein VE398_11215, partial [Acidobacteriota bacterium]|nr:hypothetical protein [Acidobacteriota bacterium]